VFEAPLADVEDGLLGLVHHIVHAGALVVGDRGDLVGGVDHLAADRVSLHDAPVGFGVERGRHLVDQRRQVGGSADLAQLAAPVQFVGNGQQVDGDALLVQAGERLPDPFVTVDVEIVRAQELGDVVIDFRVNENRPYDGFFGFTAVRDCR
jgi:hypothetical protein